ncbi:MAG: NUDIX domain-containing protein [Chitinivibrionales bacterium]|nr:NUDIX domain-containing protein [Chitinivibrionales bacterium]MBD3358784.1 NUDIX domain-containing protein [Chitinivibrionales bacterium]
MKKSAGLLMYRFRENVLQVLLGHMGGPFWAKKDDGAWSIPKGEYGDDEDAREAAKREFYEETGFMPRGDFRELAPAKRPRGKHIRIWAFEGNCDPTKLISNTFKLQWPPHSGKTAVFPELNKAKWLPVTVAQRKIVKSQRVFLDALCEMVGNDQVVENGGTTLE